MHGAIEPTAQDEYADDLRDLLCRSAQGDEEAFACLYDAMVGEVYGLSVRALRDRAQAEEVAHESFMDVWLHASRFDPSRGSVHAWVFTIAHRKAVSRVRSAVASSKRETRYHLVNHRVEYDSTAELALRSTECETVRAAVGHLTALQRQAIELVYFEGLTVAEMATSLRIPLSTAKTRVRDGLRGLRAEWPQAA